LENNLGCLVLQLLEQAFRIPVAQPAVTRYWWYN